MNLSHSLKPKWGEAEFVILHAREKARRGKRPSLPWNGIKNPQRALKAATEEVQRRAESGLACIVYKNVRTGLTWRSSWMTLKSARVTAASMMQRQLSPSLEIFTLPNIVPPQHELDTDESSNNPPSFTTVVECRSDDSSYVYYHLAYDSWVKKVL